MAQIAGVISGAFQEMQKRQRVEDPDGFDEHVMTIWRAYQYAPEAFADYWRSLNLSILEETRIRMKMLGELHKQLPPVANTLKLSFSGSAAGAGSPFRRRKKLRAAPQQSAQSPARETTPEEDARALSAKMYAQGMLRKEGRGVAKLIYADLPTKPPKEKKKSDTPSFTDTELKEVAELHAVALKDAKQQPEVTGRGRYRARVPNNFWEGQAGRIRPDGDAKAFATPLRRAVTAWKKKQIPRTPNY
ncbi:MAG TPA: hypothetical protein VGC87_23195 [Pyrinomonadaceae bacterium]|jgi:hypothetical protein